MFLKASWSYWSSSSFNMTGIDWSDGGNHVFMATVEVQDLHTVFVAEDGLDGVDV